MKVIATNISEPQTISWRGKDVKTGIYKYPTDEPIELGTEDVVGDTVVDRRYHGGTDKACYLYAADHYPFWKLKYQDLEWNYGMFGENLTILGLDEGFMQIGDIYKIGTAIIQVAQPREPCYKLGVRFGDQKVVKDFVHALKPGVYVRVLEPGTVTVEDKMILHETIRPENTISIRDMYRLLLLGVEDQSLVDKALNCEFITPNNKEYLLKKYKG